MISGIECCVFFSACCQVKAHYPEARLVLRFRADDPNALCQLGVEEVVAESERDGAGCRGN